MRRLIVLLVAVGLLALSACTGSTTSGDGGFISGDGSISRVPIEQRVSAPVLTGTTLDGTPWSSTSVQGKVLVYNVWGSWCAPCQKEAPALVKAANRTAGIAQFIGLNTRDIATAQADAFVRNFQVPYPNLFDPDGSLLLEFGGKLPPSAIPSTLIVDNQGRIAARVIGETTEATLVALIEEIAAEPPMIALEVGDWARDAVGGSMLMAMPVALLAGLVSFFSPCVLPLLPGYLSYASGLSLAQLQQGEQRGRVLAGTALFVLGFAVVFVSGGALFGSMGTTLMQWRTQLNIVGGILAICLGLVFAGWVPFASNTVRLNLRPKVGLAAAPLLGLVFALGWTPCIGPALQVVLTLALNEATAGRGALLALCYALGLGLPFLIAGLALDRFSGTVAFVQRHHRSLQIGGGVMMIIVGVLLLTGGWDVLMATMRQWAASFGTVI